MILCIWPENKRERGTDVKVVTAYIERKTKKIWKPIKLRAEGKF